MKSGIYRMGISRFSIPVHYKLILTFQFPFCVFAKVIFTLQS